MASNNGFAETLTEQNARKELLQKITFTTSAALTTLSTTTIGDLTRPLEKLATLCLQADADFFYEMRTTGQVTAVTDSTGSRPGVKVLAGQQEYVVLDQKDAAIDVKGSTASGNLAVFVCTAR